MHWASLGHSWEIRFREIEHFVRRFSHARPSAPDDELPEAELPDGEQQAALRREAARRLQVERE